MEYDQIETKIDNLESRAYDVLPHKNVKFRMKPVYYQAAVPILILFLLVIFRPKFVMSEKEDEKSKETYFEMNYSKLILWVLIFSTTLYLGYYGYTYKKKD